MIGVLLGIFLVLVGIGLTVWAIRTRNATEARLTRLEAENRHLADQLTLACEAMNGLIDFFNNLPPSSAIKAGEVRRFRLRLPDRQKLTFR